MNRKPKSFCWTVLTCVLMAALSTNGQNNTKDQRQPAPNIVIIYADDLGFGDLSCYGAFNVKTPNIDRIASGGLRFINAYSTSATCTPSRYSLLTGIYAWRQPGTGIARGNAGLIIPPGITTLPGMLQKRGYKTGVVGKWHLGLGPAQGPDWNAEIRPGPLEIGFDYSFILPATGDRVPCVYLENHRVVGLDPADSIQVSYDEKIGSDPTGLENPQLLKMKFSHGHDQTIVNGISRIGYMSGGRSAWWVDEDMADVITNRAIRFINQNKSAPFFLYFATHDIHVPRVPHSRFAGKSGMGPRGDAILQLDWSVGEIMKALKESSLLENTIIVFSSDNGPVLDDGYHDQAVELLNGHTPSGGLRGGKYSAFEAGTRVPFLVHWPGQVKPGVSNAILSQIDLYASFASLVGQQLLPNDAPDSFVALEALLGKSQKGRDHVIQQSLNNTLSLVKGNWKIIEPSRGNKVSQYTNIELGNNQHVQLYNLKKDPGETKNVAHENADVVKQLRTLITAVRAKSILRQQ